MTKMPHVIRGGIGMPMQMGWIRHASQTVPSCDDALIEVASPESTDCDDSDPMIYPTANEICDDVDNNW